MLRRPARRVAAMRASERERHGSTASGYSSWIELM
jgi:hypothetical protein